jgi:surface polysaccharide O-acyltransferase-like enzyme
MGLAHLLTLLILLPTLFRVMGTYSNNNRYVQGATTYYHKTKTPMIFLKLILQKLLIRLYGAI